MFETVDNPVLAAANYLARSMVEFPHPTGSVPARTNMRRAPPRRVCRQTPIPGLVWIAIAPGLGTQPIPDSLVKVIDSRRFVPPPES